MSKSYYVMATLGSSPAVLTELLWALCVLEGVTIAGLEVWTTGGDPAPPRSGEAQLDAFALKGGFGDLFAALPGTRLPEFTRPVAPDQAIQRLAHGGCPYSIATFERDGVPLDDVRDGQDARAMDVQLFERVRTLRDALPDDVHLLGSLAGGRKTMSSSLQSAFSLQARPDDRLVHVLLNGAIELSKDPDWRTFTVPDPKWGLPLEAQIELHDVRFPRLRPLLQGSPLRAAIDGLDYGATVEMLDAIARDDLCAELTRVDDTQWSYTVRSLGGGVRHSVSLSDRQGQALWLLVKVRTPISAFDLFEAFSAHGVPFEEIKSRDPLEQANRATKVVHRLRQRLAPLKAVGLKAFAVETVHKRYRVPAAFDGHVTLSGSLFRS